MLLKAYIVPILVSVQLVLKIKDKKSPFLWNLLPRNQDFKLQLCPNKTSRLTLSLYTIVNTRVNTFHLTFCHRILTFTMFHNNPLLQVLLFTILDWFLKLQTKDAYTLATEELII